MSRLFNEFRCFLMGFVLCFVSLPSLVQGEFVDNASLLPPVLPDDQVKMEGMSPDWVKTLIMAQFRIGTATAGGTFQDAVRVLDHYAETGVNGLWINPVYERDGKLSNKYGNFGPHTIDPALTGCETLEGSFREVRAFVDEAHKRNIRVLFDIIVWGTDLSAPLIKERPEFFVHENGVLKVNHWNGYSFEWGNEEFREWFKNAAVNFIEKTGADGFRVDLAPDVSGYSFADIRKELYKKGHKIIIMSELPSLRRNVFDFGQLGVNGWPETPDFTHMDNQKAQFGDYHSCQFMFREDRNIVDAIQTGAGIGEPTLQQDGDGGRFRFYCATPLCHDGRDPFIQGNRARFGYVALTPFIPLWWIGEEWNNPMNQIGGGGAMYFNEINWEAKKDPKNASFFEDVKKMIAIRRSYPELFENFSDRLRNANIQKLVTVRDGKPNPLQAYVRYSSDKAILVVPNYQSSKNSSCFLIQPDFKRLRFPATATYQLTDLMSGEIVSTGSAKDLAQVETVIQAEHMGLYLLQKKQKTSVRKARVDK